jgi:hypothetical protein
MWISRLELDLERSPCERCDARWSDWRSWHADLEHLGVQTAASLITGEVYSGTWRLEHCVAWSTWSARPSNLYSTHRLVSVYTVFNSHSMLFHFTRDRWFHFQVINIGEEKGEISTQILLCLPGQLIRARTPRTGALRARGQRCIFSLAREETEPRALLRVHHTIAR